VASLPRCGCETNFFREGIAPGLTREDIQACIAYGSEMARERFVEISLEARA
jgi:hypothetical protein